MKSIESKLKSIESKLKSIETNGSHFIQGPALKHNHFKVDPKIVWGGEEKKEGPGVYMLVCWLLCFYVGYKHLITVFDVFCEGFSGENLILTFTMVVAMFFFNHGSDYHIYWISLPSLTGTSFGYIFINDVSSGHSMRRRRCGFFQWDSFQELSLVRHFHIEKHCQQTPIHHHDSCNFNPHRLFHHLGSGNASNPVFLTFCGSHSLSHFDFVNGP